MTTRTATPNRVPRLLRAAVASLHDIIVREVKENVVLKREEYFAAHRNDREQIAEQDLWLQYLPFPGSAVMKPVVAGLDFHDGLKVRVLAKFRLGPAVAQWVAGGSYAKASNTLRLFLEGTAPSANYITSGPWEDELYYLMAHEMTHMHDPSVKDTEVWLRHKPVDPEVDMTGYFQSLRERKAFARGIAEEVAHRIERLEVRAPRIWRAIAPTPERALYRFIWDAGDTWGLSVHLTKKQMDQVYKDIFQFLDDEGLVDVVRKKYEA